MTKTITDAGWAAPCGPPFLTSWWQRNFAEYPERPRPVLTQSLLTPVGIGLTDIIWPWRIAAEPRKRRDFRRSDRVAISLARIVDESLAGHRSGRLAHRINSITPPQTTGRAPKGTQDTLCTASRRAKHHFRYQEISFRIPSASLFFSLRKRSVRVNRFFVTLRRSPGQAPVIRSQSP